MSRVTILPIGPCTAPTIWARSASLDGSSARDLSAAGSSTLPSIIPTLIVRAGLFLTKFWSALATGTGSLRV